MAGEQRATASPEPEARPRKFKFPTAFTVLAAVLLLVWIASFWNWFENADIKFLGFVIVVMFVATWAIALLTWRLGRIEERWSAHLEDSGPAPVEPAKEQIAVEWARPTWSSFLKYEGRKPLPRPVHADSNTHEREDPTAPRLS